MNGLQIPFTGIRRQYNLLRNEILEAIDIVLRSGHLTDGNYTAEFENWLAKKNGSKYAITCHSGTQALEIIAKYYLSQNFWPNPARVLIPSMAHPATANAFMRAGFDIVLCDTDYHGLLDFKKIDRGLSMQAILAIGLYGHALNKHEWLNNNAAIVIEDATHHWLSYECRRIANAAAISFDSRQNFNSYNNGGAIITNDINLMDYAKIWRHHGKPAHLEYGNDSRMSETDCAQMLVKTNHIDKWQKRRSEIANYWCQRLKGTGSRSLIDDNNQQYHACNKFVIEVSNRDILQRNLTLKGIETQIHYKEPLHELPGYSNFIGPDILSAASSLSRRVLSLPIYPELTDLEVEYIIDQVLDNI